MQMASRPASVSRRVCARGAIHGLDMEKILRKFCQIHALSALFGRNAIQPADILNFCKNHVNTDTGLGAALTEGGV